MDKAVIAHTKTEGPKTAAIYARVSRSDQLKGTSLDGQVAICHDYAKKQGYAVIKVVQEDASGARLDRPKLEELRDLAARGVIDALIVFDPDRLSRSLAHTMLLLEEFERNKVDVLFVNAPQEDTPEGETLLGMRALFAEYELTKIAERTRRGIERRIQDGQVISSRCCPFGYEYIAMEKRLQVLESEAMWVEKIFEWAVHEGYSLREIARRLQENDVPRKRGAKAWQPPTVRAILNNETYAGSWHYGRYAVVEPKNPRSVDRRRVKSSKQRRPSSEWQSVSVPAIVSRELYDAASALLKHNQAVSARNIIRQYLFRGLLTCSRCGHKMYGYTATSGTYICYNCPGRTQKPVYSTLEKRCDQRNVSLRHIEILVWDEVVRQVGDEKVLRAKLEEREATRVGRRTDDETESELLSNIEANLKREANKLLDLHMSDVIDEETLRERMAVLREKQACIAKTKAEMVARFARGEVVPGSRETIEQLCEIARRGFSHATFEEKRALLEGMNVSLHLDGDKVTVMGLLTDRTLMLSDAANRRAAI